MKKDILLPIIKNIENNYKAKTTELGYIENGILLCEGLMFCAAIDLFDIDIIIESGVAGGRSTEIWAKYFDKNIIGIDNATLYGMDRFNNTKNRLSNFSNVLLINNDSFIEIRKLIKKYKNSNIALFIDGPKGKDAIALAAYANKYKNIKIIAIHDMAKPANYHLMDKYFSTCIYSDEEWFFSKFSYIDLNKSDTCLKKELQQNPRGPGLGMTADPVPNTLLNRIYLQCNFYYNLLFSNLRKIIRKFKCKHN